MWGKDLKYGDICKIFRQSSNGRKLITVLNFSFLNINEIVLMPRNNGYCCVNHSELFLIMFGREKLVVLFKFTGIHCPKGN